MLVACVLLAAATLTAYSNSLRCPFVFDDAHDIVANLSIRRLWPVWQLFVVDWSGRILLRGRPIVNISFAINYATAGLNTFPYHVTNLAIHILAGWTLFGITRRTLVLPGLAGRYAKAATPLAFSVAGIWLLHPLVTQAVTYVVQRYESMMGLFYLLSLYCLIRSHGSSRARWWAGGAVAACLLAMGSKEVAVSVPLILLLFDRAFLAGSFREAWRRRWGMYLGLAVVWAAFAVFVKLSMPTRTTWAGFGLPVSWFDYAKSQFGVILHYLRLAFWPHPLVFDYGWPVARTAAAILPGLIVVGALVAASVWALVRRPVWGTLGAWVFLILAPTSSVMPIVDLAFEHRMYLSLVAVVVAVVIGAYELLEWLVPRSAVLRRKEGWVRVVPALAVFAVLGAATYARNRVYASDESVWRAVTRDAPDNPRGYCNLGAVYFERGQIDEAFPYYRRALEFNPQFAGAHYGVACILDRQGKTDEAAAHYRRALRLNPKAADIHYNLAIVLRRQGDVDGAVAHYQKALQIDPLFANAHYNLANILGSQGRTDEAIARYRKVLELNPESVDARYNLAIALRERGDVDEAIVQYRKALEIDPRAANVHYNLANALGWQGKIDAAIVHYQKALEVNPSFTQAREVLDRALRLRGGAPPAGDPAIENSPFLP